uniref:Uncharacterized protein n=1 Tax=Opuntia streptacantha TaxID=393608 RepID=A0A7C9DX57_OPUST
MIHNFSFNSRFFGPMWRAQFVFSPFYGRFWVAGRVATWLRIMYDGCPSFILDGVLFWCTIYCPLSFNLWTDVMTTKLSNGSKLFLFSSLLFFRLLFWNLFCCVLGVLQRHLTPCFGLNPRSGFSVYVFICFYPWLFNPLGKDLCIIFNFAPCWVLIIQSLLLLMSWTWSTLLNSLVFFLLMLSFFDMGSKPALKPLMLRSSPLVHLLHEDLLFFLHLCGRVFIARLFFIFAGNCSWCVISIFRRFFCLVLVLNYYFFLLGSKTGRIQDFMVSSQGDLCFELVQLCLLTMGFFYLL